MGIADKASAAARAVTDAVASAAGRVGDATSDASAAEDDVRGDERPCGNVDDDPLDGDAGGEQLPPLDTSPTMVEADVEALDARATHDAQAPPRLPDDPHLWDRIDPRGPSGQAADGDGHQAGLRSLVTNMADLGLDDGAGTFDLGLVRAILTPLGDRLSLAMDDSGITVTGLLRRRHTSWDDVERIRMTSRYALFSGKGIGRLSGSIVGKITPPVPGLAWVVAQVIGALGGMLERLLVSGAVRDSLEQSAGWVVTEVERPWFDIQLDGLMLLVSGLAKGTGEAIAAEAEARGIPVQRS